MKDSKKQTLILLSAALFLIGIMFLVSALSSPRFNNIPVYEITEMPAPTRAYETTAPITQAPIVTLPESETVNQTTTLSRININTATQEELMLLKSVGEVKAQAIIDYRNNNGRFRDVYELSNVEGISDKIIAENLGNIIV